MTWVIGFLIVVGAVLAFVNGANDNAKGVATLVGGRVVGLRGALWYAAAATGAGSIAAVWFGASLAAKFKGKGIVDEAVLGTLSFPLCVGIAASVTVGVATVVRIPISTTHAIVGAIIGIAWASGAVVWGKVWSSFFYPLLFSPLIAAGVTAVLYLMFRAVRRAMGVTHQTCLCVEREVQQPVTVTAEGVHLLVASGVKLTKDQVQNCRQRYNGDLVGIDAQRVLDGCHILTAGAVSFARGLNDTPKVAALMIGLTFFSHWQPVVIVGVAMAVGGLLAVRRVAQTMSYRITGMNDGQAFTGNLVTAVLVIFASKWGLPVSTTHVSCGSLFGLGAVNRRANWKMISTIVAAWITTLPMAGAIGYASWRLLG